VCCTLSRNAACFSPQPWGKYGYSSLGHSAALEQRLGEREIPFAPRASGLAGRETHREPLWVDALYAAVDPPVAQGVLQSVLVGDRLSARGLLVEDQPNLRCHAVPGEPPSKITRLFRIQAPHTAIVQSMRDDLALLAMAWQTNF